MTILLNWLAWAVLGVCGLGMLLLMIASLGLALHSLFGGILAAAGALLCVALFVWALVRVLDRAFR